MKRRLPKFRVRKLTSKPAFLTIADYEPDPRRIHFADYALDLLPVATKSNACRIQSDLDWPEPRIAALICFASPRVNRAAKSLPLAFCVPIFGLPTLFFIIFVNKNVDAILIFVNNKCKILAPKDIRHPSNRLINVLYYLLGRFTFL